MWVGRRIHWVLLSLGCSSSRRRVRGCCRRLSPLSVVVLVSLCVFGMLALSSMDAVSSMLFGKKYIVDQAFISGRDIERATAVTQCSDEIRR